MVGVPARLQPRRFAFGTPGGSVLSEQTFLLYGLLELKAARGGSHFLAVVLDQFIQTGLDALPILAAKNVLHVVRSFGDATDEDLLRLTISRIPDAGIGDAQALEGGDEFTNHELEVLRFDTRLNVPA